jgi:hypothetical protein
MLHGLRGWYNAPPDGSDRISGTHSPWNRAVAFTLETVVPWGRSFKEYARMFALTHDDLAGRILCCADGPASFNAEATRRGARVVSCDPLYRYSGREIRDRIDATYPEIMNQLRQNHREFVWTEFASAEDVGRARMRAMQVFLDDYDAGRRESRYLDAELPSLPFPDQSFDLALCSHYLFLYTDQLTEDFHVDGIREMARVAQDVRIFPVVALGGARSRHMAPVGDRLQASRLAVTVQRVPYEFVRGSNEMMCVRRNRGSHRFV